MAIIQSDIGIMKSRSRGIHSHINAFERSNGQAVFDDFTTANPNVQMQNIQRETTSLRKQYCGFLRRDLAHIESIARGFEELDRQIGINNIIQ